MVLELLREEPGIPTPLQPEVLILLGRSGNILLGIERTLSHCREAGSGWTASESSQIKKLREGIEEYQKALSLVLDLIRL
jgi:hypothetical protein